MFRIALVFAVIVFLVSGCGMPEGNVPPPAAGDVESLPADAESVPMSSETEPATEAEPTPAASEPVTEAEPTPALPVTHGIEEPEDEEGHCGSLQCIHTTEYDESFHTYPPDIPGYVTIDEFNKWHELDYKKTPECPYYGQNIYEYIKYFSIPRDVFEKYYYDGFTYYYYDYNLDLLYGGDEDAVYEYYARSGERHILEKRSAERLVKSWLEEFVGRDKYREWAKEKGYVRDNGEPNYTAWSIPELIYDFEIPESALSNIIDQLRYTYADTLCIEEAGDSVISKPERKRIERKYYNFDFDLIYGDGRAEIERMIQNGVPGYEIDAMIHD